MATRSEQLLLLSINFTVTTQRRFGPISGTSSLTVPDQYDARAWTSTFPTPSRISARRCRPSAMPAICSTSTPDPTHFVGFNLINPLAINGTQNVNVGFNTAGLSVGTHSAVRGGGQTGTRSATATRPTNATTSISFNGYGAGQAGPDREQYHRPAVGGAGQQFQSSPTRSKGTLPPAAAVSAFSNAP